MERAVGHGLAATPWERQADGDPDAHLRRAAGFLAWSHTEPGHGCPISMTYAAIPALRVDDALAKEWTPLLASTTYDPGLRPVAREARRAVRHGHDREAGRLRRPRQRHRGAAAADGSYTLHGHKWFTSAPMNDVFLVLAQAAGGVTCFVVPRVLPDGTRNQLDVVRLKDKLGNRSNASSELEFDGTVALRLGDEGRGVRTIIEMVAATRLDCVLGSAGLMRRAVSEASWHVAHRSAFGSLLADKPLMQNVVADLAVESEAATVLALRLASAVDDLADPHEAALRRIALPLAKFWVCKRTPGGHRRGAGVPGRQRVRRGVADAAPLPRGAAQLGLGGLGQRQRARRAARAGPRARGAGGVDHRGRPGPRRRRPPRRGHRRDAGAARRADGRPGPGSRSTPAGWPAGWPRCSRARCWCASRRPRWPTSSARRGSARRTTARSARSPVATCAGSSTRATPNLG